MLGGRVRLTQVVVNLVNNAIDALTGIGAKGPTDNPVITISAKDEGGDVRLVIADNGPGLAPAERETVFEDATDGTTRTVPAQGGMVGTL